METLQVSPKDLKVNTRYFIESKTEHCGHKTVMISMISDISSNYWFSISVDKNNAGYFHASDFNFYSVPEGFCMKWNQQLDTTIDKEPHAIMMDTQGLYAVSLNLMTDSVRENSRNYRIDEFSDISEYDPKLIELRYFCEGVDITDKLSEESKKELKNEKKML